MSVETLITHYGYPVLLLGTLLEGETVLLVAGFLAHRGYLQVGWVMAIATLGAYISDQTFFQLGRHHGGGLVGRLLEHRPHWHAQLRRAEKLLHRYQTPVILGFRFLYGLRTVTPFAIGMSGVSVFRFMLLDAIAAGVWAVIITLLGYAFGAAIESTLAHVRHYELWIALGLLAGGALLGLWHWWRQNR